MQIAKIVLLLPMKEVSGIVELAESVNGVIQDISMESNGRRRRSSKPRKEKVFLTHEIAASVLDEKKKHPGIDIKRLASNHNISVESTRRILTGTAAIMKKTAVKKKKGGKK